MVQGKYRASGDVLGQHIESQINYRVQGNVLTGTVTVPDSVIQVQNGTVSGDSFTHQLEVPTLFGKVKVKVEGQVSGNDITLTLTSPMGNSVFKGKRV